MAPGALDPPSAGTGATEAIFYFDLANPLAYLAAELAPRALGATARWQPIRATDFQGSRAEVETLASRLALPPLRWPPGYPFDSEPALLVATFASQIGRVIGFAQAAFRQAFAGGRDLSQPDWVLVAAAACELHPRAILGAMARPAIAAALADATAAAAARGVHEVPCIAVDGRQVSGLQAVQALTEAAAAR